MIVTSIMIIMLMIMILIMILMILIMIMILLLIIIIMIKWLLLFLLLLLLLLVSLLLFIYFFINYFLYLSFILLFFQISAISGDICVCLFCVWFSMASEYDIACPVCGASVKGESLLKHLRKFHKLDEASVKAEYSKVSRLIKRRPRRSNILKVRCVSCDAVLLHNNRFKIQDSNIVYSVKIQIFIFTTI